MNYKEELSRAMAMVAAYPNSIFIGQGVIHPDVTSIIDTLKDVPLKQRIELPIMENTQMGMCLGLSLQGFLPVSIYPRIDFLLLALDQLVNHLDKFAELSCWRFKPKVIIRTSVGAKNPLHPGPQHCQNHSKALDFMLENIQVFQLIEPEFIVPSYERALKSDRSTILVEFAEMM